MQIKIYKVTSPNTDRYYIGMTSRSLSRRLVEHLKCEEYNTRGRYRYCSVFEIIRAGSPSIELVETIETEGREVGHGREIAHIEEGGALCCNMVRTASLRPVVSCPCGGHYSIEAVHKNTKRHQQFMEDNANE